MKIIALSDIHGNLIKIKNSSDVVIIAGDWSPLEIQHNSKLMLHWINSKFIPWLKELNTENVIFIPGNHDLVCTLKSFNNIIDTIISNNGATNKIYYLNHNFTILNNKKFYGMPDNESPSCWAFANQYHQNYNFDNDTDILITHQPPRIGDVGYVKIYNRDLGSINLRDKIMNSNIELNICGHIHTGDHKCQPIMLNNGKLASVYNVSILDEDYEIAYKPTVIRI